MQDRQPLREGMPPIDVGLAIRADHEDPARSATRPTAEHPDRRVVGPMEVVDHEQNRRRLGEPEQYLADRVVQW